MSRLFDFTSSLLDRMVKTNRIFTREVKVSRGGLSSSPNEEERDENIEK